MKSLALSALLFAAAAMPVSALAADQPPVPQVAVTGQGEARLAPDMAIVTLSVATDEKTARQALDANNEAMAGVLDAMKQGGIAERDLQTSGFSINPRYIHPNKNDGTPPRIDGYQVVNSLTVRIRDLSKLGVIIDRSVSLGVNQGGNIHFTNDDPSAAIADARRQAVADAMKKARTLVEAAGVGLGRIMTISEQSHGPRPMPMARAEMAMRDASPVPVAAGENTYRVNVAMTFELAQ